MGAYCDVFLYLRLHQEGAQVVFLIPTVEELASEVVSERVASYRPDRAIANFVNPTFKQCDSPDLEAEDIYGV